VSRGLSGHLELVCGLDSRGISTLRHQSFRAPIHLSKPHLDEGLLVVNVVNPTAGLLAGDRIACDVRVESGAALLLTSPSASRAHCAGDSYAEVSQRFEVSAGGFLENDPELFIPQGGARYRQRTMVRLAEKADVIFVELLAPGRVASGEVLDFAELRWETDFYFGSVHVVRERYHVTPGAPNVVALRERFPTPYFANCFVFSPKLTRESECWGTIHGLQSGSLWIGCGRLATGGWVIKCLAGGSVELRRAMQLIRRKLYEALGRSMPSRRRAGCD
jgi:urease accessory protein